jgi:hypothetical protein
MLISTKVLKKLHYTSNKKLLPKNSYKSQINITIGQFDIKGSHIISKI